MVRTRCRSGPRTWQSRFSVHHWAAARASSRGSPRPLARHRYATWQSQAPRAQAAAALAWERPPRPLRSSSEA
eukprot:7292511-Pyramimonas_sp.AAC.1